MLEITCVLNSKEGNPLYLQLYTYLKQEIQSGRIPPHSKLPSQRRLSQHLSASRNTVDAAYQQLLVEGYVRSEPRRGLFVEDLNLDVAIATGTNSTEGLCKGLQKVLSSAEAVQKAHSSYDFRQDGVDLECVPLKTWRKLMSQTLQEEHLSLCLNGDPQGESKLRQAIAHYLFQSRGVNCQPEHIVIGAGNQYLLTLLCSLVGRDKVYALEEPGFHRARAVLKNEGVQCVSIPLDEKGTDVVALRASGAKVAYVTPSNQFPVGTIMPIARRRELIQWAKDLEGFIIEDDYDGEFRYQGRPIPALQGLDEEERTIYLGTFSKSLFPSLCISYMVLPPSLLGAYKEQFSFYKQTVPRAQQHSLARFMEEGHWDRHLSRVRNHYKRKRLILLEVLEHTMGEHLDITDSESGLHILLAPKNDMSEDELISSAARAGVKIYPTSVYYHNAQTSNIQPSSKQAESHRSNRCCSQSHHQTHSHSSHQSHGHSQDHGHPLVLMGFGAIPLEEAKVGVEKLKQAWFA